VKLRDRNLTSEMWADAINLYEDGWTTIQIADQMGRDVETIPLGLHRHGVVMGSGGISRRSTLPSQRNERSGQLLDIGFRPHHSYDGEVSFTTRLRCRRHRRLCLTDSFEGELSSPVVELGQSPASLLRQARSLLTYNVSMIKKSLGGPVLVWDEVDVKLPLLSGGQLGEQKVVAQPEAAELMVNADVLVSGETGHELPFCPPPVTNAWIQRSHAALSKSFPTGSCED
jgi:hypothetical protein